MNEMNVYDGDTGKFLYSGMFNEDKAKTELLKGNAVELYNAETNEPVRDVCSYSICTDSDGYASLNNPLT